MYNFLRWIVKYPVRISKHQASKKGYKHEHGLSFGQMKDSLKGK